MGGQSFFGGEGVSRGYTTLGYWVLEGLLKRQIWESLLNQQFFGEMGYVICFFCMSGSIARVTGFIDLIPTSILSTCRHDARVRPTIAMPGIVILTSTREIQ